MPGVGIPKGFLMETERQAQLKRRLARMRGQVEGLQKMVEGGDWKKMLGLAAAIEGAADGVTGELYEGYLESVGGKALAKDTRNVLDLVLKRV